MKTTSVILVTFLGLLFVSPRPCAAQEVTEGEIGRAMKRLCARPNYVHLNSLALGFLILETCWFPWVLRSPRLSTIVVACERRPSRSSWVDQ